MSVRKGGGTVMSTEGRRRYRCRYCNIATLIVNSAVNFQSGVIGSTGFPVTFANGFWETRSLRPRAEVPSPWFDILKV